MVGPATRNLWGVGIARPTAALLRSLQWVSDSRSRVAEPVGRWEVCYTPQLRCFAACSGFQIVGPAMRNLWGRWEGCSTHSGAASQLAVGFGWSVPLRGTFGEMGGLLIPTAALLRSLQWVSDSRSRYAEPMGDMGGWLIPTAALLRSLQWVSDGRSRVAEPVGCGDCSTHSGAASQLAVGFRWSVPLRGTCGVRWEMAVSCVRCAVSWRDTSI